MLPRPLLVFQNYLQQGERCTELSLHHGCAFAFRQVPHLLARCTPLHRRFLPTELTPGGGSRGGGGVVGSGEPRFRTERRGSSSAWIHENCHLMLGLLSVSPALVTSFPIKLMIPNQLREECAGRLPRLRLGTSVPKADFQTCRKRKGGGGRGGHPLSQAGKVTVHMQSRGPFKLS